MMGCRQLEPPGPGWYRATHLIPAQIHSGSAAPLLQAGVSQLQGGRLGLQICIQLVNVSLHFCHFLLCLRAHHQKHLPCTFWPGTHTHLHLCYLPELPLQLAARLLLLVVAFPERELGGPALSLQLIPQLRQQETPWSHDRANGKIKCSCQSELCWFP